MQDPTVGPTRTNAALAASELRYRRLFETAKDGILILDAETGLVVDVNPFLVSLLGYPYDQFVGKAIWELGFFRDAIANQAKFLELQQHEYVRYENLPLETATGERREVEFVSNVYLVDGKRVIQCNIRDITARRRAEAALHASEHFLQEIINALPVRVFWKDRALNYLGCNTAFARDAGCADTRKVIGKTDHQLSWRDQAELYGRADRAVMDSGAPSLNIEEPQTTPDGHTLTLLTSKVPLRNATGEVVGVLGTYSDITEHKRAEEGRARLAMAVEQSAETIVVTDRAGIIVYVNPAFARCTGYTSAEAIGQNPRILKSGQQDAAFYRRMWAVLARGEVWRGHFTNRRKNGSLFEEEASISPVRDAEGHIVNYVATKRDITHEAQLENQLRQAQKMEAVGRLAGGVAHDFNNLLTGIIGYAELCRDQIGPGHPIREWLDEITREAARSADITRQLLAFARKQTIAPRVLDLNDAVAGMLKLLRRLIGEDVTLAWHPGASLWPAQLDPSQVDQILANLCVNARDAIAGAGTITLHTGNVEIDAAYCATHAEAAPGAYVMLTVCDDGCGMDQATAAQIFEPFFSTKDPGQGTGLGLATVYGIVRQNGGFINVESEPGQGATFRVYLPRTDAEVPAAAPAPEPAAPRGDGETILLVEDEKSLRVTCTHFLHALGYRVLPAESPQEAIRIAESRTGALHLLLTDVVMPGMDGRQLARRIQALIPGARVLYMSGYPADVIAQRGVLERDTAFLAKPFTRTDLALKVKEVLAAAPPPPGSGYTPYVPPADGPILPP